MCQQDRNRCHDLFHIHCILKHVSPDDHVGGEKVGLYVVKQWNLHSADDRKENDHRHGCNDGSDGIIRKAGKHHG